jgi:hypothetical protein
MPKVLDTMKDLGLSYEEAAHGVQCAILTDMNGFERCAAVEPKHMRTGIDMSKADMLGLAALLMDKGVITHDEYVEYMRRAANQEVAMREEEAFQKYGRRISFR